jgi:hypothetical protein
MDRRAASGGRSHPRGARVIPYVRGLLFFVLCGLVVTVCSGQDHPSRPRRLPVAPTTLPAVPIAQEGTQAGCVVGGYRVVTDPLSAVKRGLECYTAP